MAIRNLNFSALVLLTFVLTSCVTTKSNFQQVHIQRFQEMESCIKDSTSRAISAGKTQWYNYADILSQCTDQLSRLTVARYAVGLEESPLDFWRSLVIKTLKLAHENTIAVETNKSRNIEKLFMTSYYALSGHLVVVNTAFQKCPKKFTNQVNQVIYEKSLSEIREIFFASKEYVAIRDERLGENNKRLVDEFLRDVSKEFIKTVDSLFVPEKLASTCPKALDMQETAQHLQKYLSYLVKLDQEDLGPKAKTALRKIKEKAVSVLGKLRNT